MKRNPLQNVITFIVRYVWIFCGGLIILELLSTVLCAGMLLQGTAQNILQAQAGEIYGRVDGVYRLLNGLAEDEEIGDTSLPIYDRAIRMRSYQKSYDLFMLAVLDREFNVVSSDETEPPQEPYSLAGRDYLQRMKAIGEYQITDMIIAGADGVTKNYTIAIPLFKNGQLDGGIFGSIYFEDIEAMLMRENQGRFCLLGRENTVMADSENRFRGKAFEACMDGEICLGTSKEQVNSNLRQKGIGGYWSFGQGGFAYTAYIPVQLTEWTLVYEASLGLVLPAILPLMGIKIFLYLLLSLFISRFGRRYLEAQLSTLNHLMDRVTEMQKKLFQTEQGNLDEIFDLTQQGLKDQLTGLDTRGVLIQRFTQFAEDLSSHGLLCFLDLDDLKIINDSYGHEVGDKALCYFSQVLKTYEEKYHGIAARYGGDEFILVIGSVKETEGEEIVKCLCEELSAVLNTNVQPILIHGSIGVAFFPQHGKRLEELISKSDLALYKAKRNGKGQYFIFESEIMHE